jgi:hypothetical protein
VDTDIQIRIRYKGSLGLSFYICVDCNIDCLLNRHVLMRSKKQLLLCLLNEHMCVSRLGFSENGTFVPTITHAFSKNKDHKSCYYARKYLFEYN